MSTALICRLACARVGVSGLSWPTLDKPFWLDVGNTSFSHLSILQIAHVGTASLFVTATVMSCIHESSLNDFDHRLVS